jgi:sugar phosphate isomerase/epimerase
MLKGLTRAGLGEIGNDEQFIELASKYGFKSVDLDAKGVIAHFGGAAKTNERLKQKGLIVGAIGLPVEWRSTDEIFRSDLVKLAEAAEAAASIGCTRCCTYVLPSVDMNAAHFMALATKRLRLCAQILSAYGIRLGLEFVGPHHLRTHWKNPFIWTMEETLDWIEAIGEPNVGLLLDAYHWYTNGLTVADIERLRAEQIVYVHINDAPDVPVAEVLDNGRLYPGEGVIDLAGFLRALHTIGYLGPVSQEILTASPPTDSPESLLVRSQSGFTKVYKAAGLE